MTTRGASLLARLLVLVVLITSGTYLLIYLYRWEWNRAIISGIFFLGAEITLAASMILGRLRRLDERLYQGLQPRPQAPEAPSEEQKPFAWLDPTGGGFGVFVPVLMGAGFVLSGLAFLVEKLSGALSPSDPLRPTAAARAGPLPVPAQGLVPAAGSVPLGSAPPVDRPRRSAVATVVALTIVGLFTVAVVDVLADATQNRPDPVRAGRTVLDLEIFIAARGPTPGEASSALWAACQVHLPRDMERVELAPTGPDRQRLVLDGVIGRNAQRRFVGCLEDAQLDRVQARVLDVVTQPAPVGAVA